MTTHISISRAAIADFCRKWGITELALFGSVLSEEFRPDSDVDVLVSFQQGRTPGFIALHHLEEELSALFGGREVDVVSRKFLNRHIRDQVIASLETLYSAA